MEELKPLFDVLCAEDYGARYLHAKKTRTCLACGNPVLLIPDKSKRLEYDVSALCPDCQARYFTLSSPDR